MKPTNEYIYRCRICNRAWVTYEPAETCKFSSGHRLISHYKNAKTTRYGVKAGDLVLVGTDLVVAKHETR